MVTITNIIQDEPCTFEETLKDQDHESIIHNDVWEVQRLNFFLWIEANPKELGMPTLITS